MKFKPIPKIDYHDIWNIDPIIGIVTWKIKQRTMNPGDNVGYIKVDKTRSNRKQILVRIPKHQGQFLLHRILYYVYNGSFNELLEIDHADGNSINNSKFNLRLANRNMNNKNATKRKDNTSGVIGISWHNKSNNWIAYFNINKKPNRMYTKDFFEAVCWRKSMELKHGMNKLKQHRTEQ